MTNRINITNVIREEFSKKKRQTINELCSVIQANPNIDSSKIDVNHRVRSSLYSMKKSGQIRRVGDATYEINSS
jgi:hypothetical protein